MNFTAFLSVLGVGLLFSALLLGTMPSRRSERSPLPAWLAFAGAVLCIAVAVALVRP